MNPLHINVVRTADNETGCIGTLANEHCEVLHGCTIFIRCHALHALVVYMCPSLAEPNLKSDNLQGLQPGYTQEMAVGLTSQKADRVRMPAVGMSVPKSVRSSLLEVDSARLCMPRTVLIPADVHKLCS